MVEEIKTALTCETCAKADAVLIWHPLLQKHLCLPCVRDRYPGTWQAIYKWVILNGSIPEIKEYQRARKQSHDGKAVLPDSPKTDVAPADPQTKLDVP